MFSREDFLKEIEHFRKKYKIKKSVFGQMALNDGAFLTDVEKGRDITLGTVARISEFMQAYRTPSNERNDINKSS